ncbi:MAG: hypothetical protein P2A85_27550 [Microcoleus anatoxicus]|uniref:hypothetical protein n=1 Tax=Microcoleus anatoxicus TaxID=2705319 RepID=UPI00366FDF09
MDWAIALHTKYQTLRSLYELRSPFLVSDERSPKMKDRSPFKLNTKHFDDCTKCDRPWHQIPNTAIVVRSAIALSCF